MTGFIFACGRKSENSGNKMIRLSIPSVNLKGESDLAYKFVFEGQAVWLPKSKIEDFEQVENDIVFWLPSWLVKDKSLEVFINNDHEPTLF